MTATITMDGDILALHLMLAESGRWMVFVHQGHIVKMTKIPPEQPIDELLTKNETLLESE